MIMGSLRRRVIGERGIGLSDDDGMMHDDQPFVVLREATFDEWLAQHIAQIAPRKPNPTVMAEIAAVRDRSFFYDVSID